MTEQEIDQLSGVLRETEAILLAVTPEQAHDPTPCADFDVAQLVDHVVGWARRYAAQLSGSGDAADPEDYRAGDAPAKDFHEAARTIVAAYRSGGPGAEQLPLGMLVADMLTHAWDLARATRRELHADPAAAELGLATVGAMLAPEHRGPGASFGPQVDVDASAPVIDQLVGFVGRDPAWVSSVVHTV